MKQQTILEAYLCKTIVTQITRIVLKYYSFVLPDLLFSLRLFDVFRHVLFSYPEHTNCYVRENYVQAVNTLYRYITDTFVSICCNNPTKPNQNTISVTAIGEETLLMLVECLYMYLTEYVVFHNAHMFCNDHTLSLYSPATRDKICRAVELLEDYDARPILDVLFENKDTESYIVIEWTYV